MPKKQSSNPRRLEDVDDEGHDEDDEATGDWNQHALVSAYEDSRRR